MRSNRKVNFMLVINAVLLAAIVLGQLGAFSLGASVAEASTAPARLPNAAAQRERMIVALDEMNKNSKASSTALEDARRDLQESVELQRQLVRLLERGNVTVTVSNLDKSERHGRD